MGFNSGIKGLKEPAMGSCPGEGKSSIVVFLLPSKTQLVISINIYNCVVIVSLDDKYRVLHNSIQINHQPDATRKILREE
jgi:hypothetical protein